MIDAFRKLAAPMRRQIALMVGRAIVRLVDDTLKCQVVQLDALAGETLDGIERFQEYGFTSVPFDGAEAVFVCPAGNRSHGIVIAVEDRRYRLKGLQGGEVAIYTDEGDKVHLKRGRNIEIDTQTLSINCDTMNVTATMKVHFATPLVEGTGDIVDQVGSGNARTLAGMRQVFDEHTHAEHDGPSTQPPTQEM